jgi:hypothetical protein
MSTELQHYGVKGMRWGVRKKYRSTSVRSAIARRSNEKVDKGFKDWNENVKRRDDAIALGKKATAARLAYEKNPRDKESKQAYRDANKAYKKALSANTTYRKGVVRKEVGQDLSRKYLSEAKKVQKQLARDPSNTQLQKAYNDLMSKHDIERAKARRATEVSQKRSQRKASMKRTMTMTIKAAATTAAISAGAYAINRYLSSRDVTVNGRSVKISSSHISDFTSTIKKVKDVFGYMY